MAQEEETCATRLEKTRAAVGVPVVLEIQDSKQRKWLWLPFLPREICHMLTTSEGLAADKKARIRCSCFARSFFTP